jgi:hypothetical protein
MKYVVILIVVVVLVRIDVVLKLFDKTAGKIQNSSEEINNEDIMPGTDLVPMDNDLSLKTSPYKTFLSMLNDFKSTGDANVKDKAIEILRANPIMFSDKLDVGLETAISGLRDLLMQRDKVTHGFLIEIMKSLKGENLEMVRRFFSFAIDIDLPEFLSVYAKSSDVNCLVMGYLGDNLPVEEKYNELAERLVVLEAFLNTEKALPYKAFGNRCLMVLRLEIDKLKTVVSPNENLGTPPTDESIPPTILTAPVTDPNAVPTPAPEPDTVVPVATSPQTPILPESTP